MFCSSTASQHVGNMYTSTAGTSRRQHITPILQQLHWLPIRSRIDYKIAIIAFKTLKTGTPAYTSLICYSSVPHPQDPQLVVSCKSTTVVQLLDVEPSVILLLPSGTAYRQNSCTSNFDSVELNTFKRHLKTHLYFNHCFSNL